MISKISMLAVSAFLVLSSLPASAQKRDDEIYRLHVACDRGDRSACVRFGMMLGENRERHEEWRHSHPEFFWWEHH